PLVPPYGLDVRLSNPSFSGQQGECQIDVNPQDNRFVIVACNDVLGEPGAGTGAGVAIYRSTDGGFSWTAQDAPLGGVVGCCDPTVAYSYDGSVYVGVLQENPTRSVWILHSVDNGGTWAN